jgi:SAM-dependent methyltransferase
MDASVYCSEPSSWPPAELAALKQVSGKVLDIGAGAGRHSLLLQHRGHEPTALDISPGAIEACRRRGIRQTFAGTINDLIGAGEGPFDAMILMGNNLALLQTEARAAGFFDAMRTLLRPDGAVIGTGIDPYLTDEPDHLAYHEANRAAGRHAGQIRMRFRYRRLATDWFGILFLAPDELQTLAARSGWTVEQLTAPNPSYVVSLRPA